MLLIESLARHGTFLFRWRSFLPLLLLPLVVPALVETVAVEETIGEAAEEVWTIACLAISFAGLAIRWATVGFVPAGTSGRNTREQRADALNTTGTYSVVRNPLYFGNFIAILGLVVAIKSWWFVLVVCLAYWLYIERIIAAEESFLADAHAAAFADYVSRTPAFIPNFSLWTSPANSFSMRTVLRREYNGVLSVSAAYVALEFVTDVLMERESVRAWMESDWWWLVVGALAVAVFAVLRGLKKRTRILHVPGR